MRLFQAITAILLIGSHGLLQAQPGGEPLVPDEHYVMGDTGEDPSPALSRYEVYNAITGGDSVRSCSGHPCIGWIEDHYAEGQLLHRGFYDSGRLTLYRNYHANGQLEREFRSADALKSTLRCYHGNGQLRSETRFVEGLAVAYEDHYVSGQLRYAEERHRQHGYYTRMDLYAADGHPISTLELVDKKRVEFLQKEYHPGGALKSEGRAQYDPSRMDTRRIGTWTYYDTGGALVRSEEYQDGRVASTR